MVSSFSILFNLVQRIGPSVYILITYSGMQRKVTIVAEDSDTSYFTLQDGDDNIDDAETRQSTAQVPPSSAGSTAGSGSSILADLKELKQLHTEGVLTDEEFAQSKTALFAERGSS